MLKFLSTFFAASTGLLAALADSPSPISNLHLRETRSGGMLSGTVSLPHGLTPTVAAHIDVVGADGSVLISRPLPVAHPRTTGSRQRRFAVDLPAGFVPVHLVLHHGVHP